MTDKKPFSIVYSKEVADAKNRGLPVVALESTIITHGMPYPGNLEMARSVERIIREQGAVPATIAVIDGVLHIGLDEARLEVLAQTQGAMKLSRADLAFAIAERRTGATTVAAMTTMAFVHEDMHQRAGQQEGIGPPLRQVGTVFGP